MSVHGQNGLNGNSRRKLLQGVDARRPPERDLPLEARLRAIADELSPTSIDELWVFPPLPSRDAGSEFILVTSFDGPERRRVLTAHVEPEFKDETSDEFTWVQRLRELGAVPQNWLESLPDGLLRRLAEAGIPQVLEIGGQLEAWEEAVTSIASANGHGNSSGAVVPSSNSASRVDRG